MTKTFDTVGLFDKGRCNNKDAFSFCEWMI